MRVVERRLKASISLGFAIRVQLNEMEKHEKRGEEMTRYVTVKFTRRQLEVFLKHFDGFTEAWRGGAERRRVT